MPLLSAGWREVGGDFFLFFFFKNLYITVSRITGTVPIKYWQFLLIQPNTTSQQKTAPPFPPRHTDPGMRNMGYIGRYVEL